MKPPSSSSGILDLRDRIRNHRGILNSPAGQINKSLVKGGERDPEPHARIK